MYINIIIMCIYMYANIIIHVVIKECVPDMIVNRIRCRHAACVCELHDESLFFSFY